MAAVPSIGRAARVERPAARDSDATRDLYERFSGQIFGYCLHQLGSREEAEDAVQTTFMNAFRGLQRGIVPHVESAWLFKIAHNVCLSRRRSSWRRRKVEAPNNLEVLQEVVPAREQIGEELIRLQDVLEGMPESQRRAILLREWQGLSYREISEELDLSQSAVETLIFRARRALATGLEVEPEQRTWRKRARHSFDAGGVLAAVKALLTGGTAVKVAATIAVATTAAVGVFGAQHRPAQHARVPSAPASRDPASSSAQSSIAPTELRAVAPQSATPQHRTRASAPRTAVTSSSAPAHDRPAAVPASPSKAPATPASLSKQGNGYGSGKANAPKRAHGHTPTKDPAPLAPTASDNSGKGHDKQPLQRDTQAVSQDQSVNGSTGTGNGHG